MCFRDFGKVYGAGEFTWDGFWTVTDPSPEAHDQLIGAWEMDDGPISRWLLPLRPDVRLFELHRPGDWAGLVARYPQVARFPHAGWELPGPNQSHSDVRGLVAGGYRHGARDEVVAHLVPDWRAIAADFDGVHLSWAGFLTTEGYISDLADGSVTTVMRRPPRLISLTNGASAAGGPLPTSTMLTPRLSSSASRGRSPST